jgi:predicted component of type VI protein secretion system
MPKLQISLPDGITANFDLTEETITVGRLPDNAIQIDDASVSSHHAQLTRDGGDYILVDLESTNGTAVNGRAHTEGKLQDGDQVRFGNVETVYASENPADAVPMPEEADVALKPAEQSVRPANFANASPFQTKKKKKDPTAVAILAFSGVSILAFALAVVSVLGLKSPL